MLSFKRTIFAAAALILLTILSCAGGAGKSNEEDVRVTAQELKEMLGGPDLIVVDVRDPVSWSKSDLKIQGAVREDPKNPSAWKDKYPRDKTIVFYCA
jgi:hypothetical protein